LRFELCLDDARRDEEDQLLVRAADGLVLEQVAEPRNAPEQGNLCHVDRVAGLDHAADNDRAAVGDQNLRGRLLRDQGRVATDRVSKVRSRVLDVHVEEDCVFDRDLRRNRKPQEGVDVARGRRSI